MATVKDYLTTELEKHLEFARKATELAEKEGRSLTEDERADVKDRVAKATELKTRIKEIEDNEAMRESIDALGSALTGTPEVMEQKDARTVGEAFVRSAGYKALKSRGMSGTWTTGPMEIKANTGFVAEDQGSNSELFIPQRVPGIIGPVQQRLTVADLLGSGQATSNSIVVVKETTTTNGAATVAEGGTKPPSNVAFDTDSVPLTKIATVLTVSDEMLEDEAQIQSYLNSRLTYFVGAEEERQLLVGGGGSDIEGLYTQAGGDVDPGEVNGDNFFDAILAAITYVRVNSGLEPDGMVIHPTDFAALSVTKAATTGNYFSGGPYAAAANNPWGLRTVVTTAAQLGHPLIGAYGAGATVWRKGGLTVEATNSHDDYFTRNLTAIRAEERLALAVYRPQAFCVAREGS